jgi:DNA-binding transcriptional ArsR family regulator
MTAADERRLSETLEVFSHPCRRRALRYLSDRTEPVGLSELADGITESASGTSERTADDVELVLHHVHLPKLADAGLVDYSANSGEVSSADADRLRRHSRDLSEFERAGSDDD